MMKQTSTIQIRFKSFIKNRNIISAIKQTAQSKKREAAPKKCQPFSSGNKSR